MFSLDPRGGHNRYKFKIWPSTQIDRERSAKAFYVGANPT